MEKHGKCQSFGPPLEPFTSTLAMMGNLAPRACANFFTSALLPGSWPPNCSGPPVDSRGHKLKHQNFKLLALDSEIGRVTHL